MNIEINNLKIKYGRRLVLEKNYLSEDFNKLQIIGRNGSGKSSLLKRIIKSKNISVNADYVILLEQQLFLFNNLSIIDNIQIQLKEVEDTYNQFISFFPTIDKDLKIKKLSGGQKQLLSLLIAINTEPELLLLDEPLNNLDIDIRRKVLYMIESLDIPVIIISHGYNLTFCESQLKIKEKSIYYEKKY